ncbi:MULTISPECIES: AbiJ-NTD4 domain-containing protein [Leuconostoc]|uniref:AbiJ-NTD4 domain-containing protein n=2 Tax=Lactobacillaceae TaxID=33958 RepID=UPI0015F5D047|nr:MULTISPECIES: hypothetical protein [Leuconostoc]MBA5937977.1 hypothetical protein [Leuconostoc citreum]MDV8932831.1 hypothetical protein [Leuconostoc citreum]
MPLFSERYGYRQQKKLTYNISNSMYDVILHNCIRYKEYLTHIFQLESTDFFLGEKFVSFNDTLFASKMKILIPSLFRNEYNNIAVPEEGDFYDQYALLDLIEYFAQNIKDIKKEWNNNKYKNYEKIYFFESNSIFADFKNSINNIFIEAGLLYLLTDDKKIERIDDYGTVTPQIEKSFEFGNDQILKKILNQAVELYKSPDIQSRKYSVEKLWDAYERLKSYYDLSGGKKHNSINTIINQIAGENEEFLNLLNIEFKALTDYGNKFSIRHSERSQVEISDEQHYDYLFNRCLSLIALALHYLDN